MFDNLFCVGESVSIQYFDGNETVLRGPITIQMVSQHAYPPMPMPVQVSVISEPEAVANIVDIGSARTYDPTDCG